MKIKILLFFVLILVSVQILWSMSDKDKKIVSARQSAINRIVPEEHPRILILKSELEMFRKFIMQINEDKNYDYIFNK
ncbi:MAG: hypothetical protein JXB50_04245, partial [Spirochaetes bacterium]|nr:hypothetical protein [Spirochaetota bacterium]